jgi:hypothetical protein
MSLAMFFAAGGAPGAVAQPARDATPARTGWAETYAPNINYEGITRAERAAAMAHLRELERIFYRIPELANPTEFVVKKQFFGGSRPQMPANGTAAYSLRIWLFARFGPDRQVAGEGCTCIEITINPYPQSQLIDEQRRPLIMEGDPGDPIPGATATYAGGPTDEREVSASVLFTRGTELPWEPVSREEYLRAQISDAEGPKGEKAAEFRQALEKTPYEVWMAEAPQRKKDRDALAAELRGIRTAEQIAEQIAALEASERDVTDRLKAQDDEDRKRNQEVLARPTYGDQLRARIEAMAPEERRQPALIAKNWELLPPDAPNGNRVLPKLEFWRVRRSPVEIHSILVSMGGATGMDQARTAVIHAIQQAYRNLDWTALKRLVEAP